MDGKFCEILNAQECEKIATNTLKLKDDVGAKIVNYVLEMGSDELEGFMGEYYKLNINVEDQDSKDGVNKLYYFVKSVPTKNEFQRAECERKRFFHKEGCAYTEILPNLQRYASTKLYPECYYARKDLLVLEDLTAAHFNYRHLGKDEPYTSKHHQLFLTHLAELHAASIAWEEKENVNIGQQYEDALFELMLTPKNEWYIAGAKGIIYLAKKYLKHQFTETQTFIQDRLYTVLMNACKYTEPSTRTRNAFLHRDTWNRNIFFKFNNKNEPTSCCIVDFQQGTYSPPALDVLYFLYGNTNAAERERHMQEYLDYYYAEFQARLHALALPAHLITKTEFLEDCRTAQVPTLICIAINIPLTMMPEGLSNKWRQQDHEKFDYYMNVERSELFERVMEIDPTYLSKIMWPIEELIQHLLSNPDLI